MEKSKPCPFCDVCDSGRVFGSVDEGYYVYCIECKARGSRARTIKAAWDKWNTRPAQMYNEQMYNDLANLIDNYNQSTLSHADRVAQLKELIRACAEPTPPAEEAHT